MFKESPSALSIIAKHHGDENQDDANAPGDADAAADAPAQDDGTTGDDPAQHMFDAVSDAE